MLLLAVLFLVGLTLLQLCLKQWKKVRMTRSIPGEKVHPILGNALAYHQASDLAEIWRLIKNLCERHMEAGIVRQWFGPLLVLVIWEPSYVEILANSSAAGKKGYIYEALFGDVFDGAFVNGGDERHRHLKKPIVRSLTKSALQENYIKVFIKNCKEYVRILKRERVGKDTFDISRYINDLMLQIFCETHLGVDLHDIEKEEEYFNIISAVDEVCENSYLSFAHQYHKILWKLILRFNSVGSKSNELCNKIDKFLTKVLIKRSLSSDTSGQEYYSDYLLKKAKEKNISIKELTGELNDFLIAGASTPSVMISSALLFLGMFPDCQEKLYAEVKGLGDEGDWGWQLSGLTYTGMVVKESIRLSSALGIIRVLTEDIKIGYHYGLSVVKVAVATIVRHFKITSHLKFEDINWTISLMTRIQNGYLVRLESRI